MALKAQNRDSDQKRDKCGGKTTEDQRHQQRKL